MFLRVKYVSQSKQSGIPECNLDLQMQKNRQKMGLRKMLSGGSEK